jgi:MFS family permease
MRSADTTYQPELTRRFSATQQALVAVLWLALYAQWMTLVPIVVPDQITGILGPDNPAKEGIAGTIGAAGALVALVVAPIAGALSDRARNARGRRRLFLVCGVLGTCAGLALLIPFGPGSSIFLYALAILHLQFWWNWTAGPYAGLIPDVVPASEQSTASGWMNVMSILGIIVGSTLIYEFYLGGRILPVAAIFIGLNIACLLLTLAGVREPPAAGERTAFDLRGFIRSFYLDPRTHRNFYWVLLTRLMANMGIWSVFTFLLFYLEEVVGLDRSAATNLLPVLLGGGTIIAIPSTLLAVRLANRHGVVGIVQTSSWIMAAAVIGYVLIALHPYLILVAPAMLIFGAANGAYNAVDWALALKVLPAGQDSGKDMGIWHICMVLPQIVGPASTGWLITGIKIAFSSRLAYEVAFGIGAVWFILAAMFIARVRLIGAAGSGVHVSQSD